MCPESVFKRALAFNHSRTAVQCAPVYIIQINAFTHMKIKLATLSLHQIADQDCTAVAEPVSMSKASFPKPREQKLIGRIRG